jgi:hypothetical protein
MAYWPPQLPKPQLAGYSLAPQAAFVRSDMDAGPARQRRRFTQAPTDIAVELVMDQQQLAIFEAWYEHRIDSGSAWFDAPMLNGQASRPRNAALWSRGAQSRSALRLTAWRASGKRATVPSCLTPTLLMPGWSDARSSPVRSDQGGVCQRAD